MTAFMITRIQTRDYESWRPMFGNDGPGAREKARIQRVLRSVDDPNEVFIYLEFASVDDAEEARERLVSSRVLDRVRRQARAERPCRFGMTPACIPANESVWIGTS